VSRPKPAKAREHLSKALKALEERPCGDSFAIGAAIARIRFALHALGDESIDPWGEGHAMTERGEPAVRVKATAEEVSS